MKALRAGTQTGSLINHLMSGSRDAPPEVGMGATVLMWTDRHAATIVEVVSPTKIRVREDKAIRTDSNGMSESQSYRYEPGPETCVPRTFTLRKNGAWVRLGEPMKGGLRLAVGHRSTYHDYSF